MTSPQEAQKQLEARTQALVALTAEQDSVTRDLQAIQNERAASVRKLAAGGNNGERKTIIDLEGKAKPLLLRLEGLDGLAVEAREAVRLTQAHLEDARARESAELAAAYEAQEFAEGQAIIAGLPGQVEKIAEAYGAVCLLVGEFLQNRIRIEDLYRRVGGADPGGIEAASMNMMVAVPELLKGRGLRQLAGSGFYGDLPIWAWVGAPADYLVENPEPVIDQFKFYAWRQAQARARFTREFQDKKEN